MPWWRNKSGQKNIPDCIDIINGVGYITLIKLNEVHDNAAAFKDTPKNGDMNEDDANLLEEEIDNLELDDDKKKKKNLTLNLPIDENIDEGRHFSPFWTLIREFSTVFSCIL